MSGRVQLLTHALDRTGPPRLALAAARVLVSVGHEVDIVAIRGGALLESAVEIGEVNTVLGPYEPTAALVDDGFCRVAATRYLRGLRDADATILVSVSASPLLGIDWIPEGRPVAAWVLERGEDLHWLVNSGSWMQRIDHWWAGARGTADELRARFGIRAGIVEEFVGDPVPEDGYGDRRRRALGIEPDARLVVGAGISTVRKGVDLFAEVARRVAVGSDAPTSFLWLGGTDSDLFHKIRQDHGIGSTVDLRFADPVDEVRPFLAAADLFLHTARNDAFPLVCLEAALATTAVVGFAETSALEEMFGDAAQTVDYPDVDGLAALATRLFDLPAELGAIAAAQRSAVIRGHVAASAGPVLARAVAELIEHRSS